MIGNSAGKSDDPHNLEGDEEEQELNEEESKHQINWF